MMSQVADRHVRHSRVNVAGVDTFYREAGPRDAPVILLPHGYPCSSFEFRNLMPLLADQWRVLAPDFPGSGYTRDPDSFQHDFDGYSAFLEQFADLMGAKRCALYLHDFGTWIGLRLAMRRPERIAALIIQNGDIYEDALGPKYDGLKEIWKMNRAEGLAKLREFVSLEHFRDEFLNAVRADLGERIPPDMWELHWPLMTDQRRENVVRIIYDLKDNIAWFSRYQAYLREHRPATLIVWGPQDGYMPEASARAYLRDLPKAELHLFDGGHWLLETNLPEVAAVTRDFLSRMSSAF